jgi:REase_DpnII-MboI
MTLSALQIAAALDAIAERIGLSDSAFTWWLTHVTSGSEAEADEYSAGVEWHLRLAYGQLLLLAEALQLPLFHGDIRREFDLAQQDDMLSLEVDRDGNEYNKWAAPARRYVAIFKALSATAHAVTKDLESILRATTYSITDPRVFQAPPANEAEVHARIECVLRSIFPDLLRKPSLAKPIKNFEPDTGILSIQTLIEYKYLNHQDDIARIADELLADTRGYTSPQWTSFIYVIYETHRFRPEAEWRHLLRECGVDPNTSVIVISGEATLTTRHGAA